MIGQAVLRALLAPLVKLLAALGIYWKGRADQRQKTALQAAEARNATLDEVRKHEMDAATQDDPALVDRLTRR